MIELTGVNKAYRTRQGHKQVLADVDLRIAPGEKVGLLGRNGSGKSTLLRLMGGVEEPDAGTIVRRMSVSWPLAFTGGFHGTLTGRDNLRFICRVYGVSADDKIDFIQDFAELGVYLDEPVRNYSSGMRARLAFALSLIIEFDCLLVDEVVSVGDSRFHRRCEIELFEKRSDRAMVLITHDSDFLRKQCRRASVLHDGRLHNFSSVEAAQEFYDLSSL
jgi:capsular polysaccharide transport system ATP-binding protein